MAWQTPIANTSGATSLGTADSLYVARPIVIGAVFASGSNQQVVVDGTIVAASDGIWFSSSSQSGNSVTVHDGGVVRGHTSTGIAFYSSDSSGVNKGRIFGDVVGVLFGGTNTTTTSTLNNSGAIESNQFGVARYFGTETVSITNSGTISGELFSYGQLAGNPVGRDLVTNMGRMIGDVDLGAGNDLYDGAGGQLTGKVFGGSGKDVIRGGKDNDTFFGEQGNDTLSGGVGNDKLTGGAGADKLTGGAGADTFIFTTIADSTVASSGRDTIMDFSRSQKDKINLKAIDASTKSAGDQAFKFIGTAAFSKKAGELRYEEKSGKTYVYGDVNGDGKADFSIMLDTKVALVAGDFTL